MAARSTKTKRTQKISTQNRAFFIGQKTLFALVIVSVALTSLVVGKMHQDRVAAAVPKSAIIFGDSLTWESISAINAQAAVKTGWVIRQHSFPGTAPCDWLTWLPQDIATYHPTVVSLSTAGNTGTPCMKDAGGNLLPIGSPEFLAKYRADLDLFFAQVTATGAKLVFIKAPPMPQAFHNTAIDQITLIATELAGKYHKVSISSVPRNAVAVKDQFALTKPCLSTETVAMGCVSGKIQIRSSTNGTPGIHFCPADLPPAYPYFCSTYSSGESRWGKALVNTTVAPPAPILP